MKRLAPWGALLLGVAAPAQAAERLELLLPACELPGVDSSELRRAVALDLQPEGLVLRPPGESGAPSDVQLVIEATCPEPDELTLRASLGGESRSGALRLSELALKQRPRALSLALAELVSQVLRKPPPRPEESEPKEPPAAPPSALPAQPPLPAAPPPAPAVRSTSSLADHTTTERPGGARWRLGLVTVVRVFDGTSLVGAQLQLLRERWRFTGGGLMGRSEARSGAVWTRLAQASAGYAMPLLTNASGATLETGPRCGVGYTWMSTQAAPDARGHDARDLYLDVAWGARYAGDVSAVVRIELGVELGYGRGPIGYADGVVLAQTSGPFASLALGGSLSL